MFKPTLPMPCITTLALPMLPALPLRGRSVLLLAPLPWRLCSWLLLMSSPCRV